jgi:hypothetical protein
MAKELFDLTLGTPGATDRFAYGTGSTLAGNITKEALRALLLDTTWTTATLNTGYSHVGGNEVKFKLNSVDQVELKGAFTVSGSPATGVLTTITPAIAPATTRQFIFSIQGDKDSYAFASINSAGQIRVADTTDWPIVGTITFNAIICR